MASKAICGVYTVEPRFNEPLFKENRDITNRILCPSYSKLYEKDPQNNEPFDLMNEFGWSLATLLNRGSSVFDISPAYSYLS